ncbi:Fe-S cluster assembly protein SufD [Blochmannia endosymbiont of Camponotus sp. C-003]|uniref:Fe-S cluster assembly protein SufD n=1 Tax=unclassified Candidatus Blochmanniella TaxID=711328 RepID=UPI0020251E57|nr:MULTISPECIES: Fe-S cluster assembly protein SufD [unclassified Candidatus Blochmannia]URJ23454.1 Fe-S cluster assembly protein SufD [Blochmannia endosymbiont of Camponotus sp. C-003]URJ28926.1 Fe-S cluster assembly protein SufD [Blochmannia endosymbiont of Camponotus sp. C-046]
MVGYADNKDRVLNEWYGLFKQKNNINSDLVHKYWERIKILGLPNFNKDNWKHTAFKEFLTYNFEFSKNFKLNAPQYEKLSFPIDAYCLTFVNGLLAPELSDKNIDPWIMKINRDPNRHEITHPIQPEMFLYLTEYLSDATIHISLPTKKITKKPLYLLYINEGSNVKNKLVTSHYHHHLHIGNDSNTCVIEHFISINKNNSHFSGARMSITTGNRSKLDHFKLIFENNASYHIAHNDINIGQYSNVHSNIFVILGPKFTSHQTSAKINHSGSSLSLNSLILLSKQDIGNICTYLEHNNQEYASSTQLHKIIACNHSTGVFNGLIKVNPNSIKTDGIMINNNLLLNQDATIYSVPKLEIYSDDVKCSHGATIGHIDADHLFYLSTRGIPKKDALKMLIYAFTIEITGLIKHAMLQDIILKKINKALIRIKI